MEREFTDTLNHDNLFNILLHADINTVTNICLTSHIDWCDSDYFWKLKFGKDELPILSPLPTNFSAWRKEYIRTMDASEAAVDLLEVVNTNDVVFNYNDEYLNLKTILPPHLRSALFNFTPSHQKFNQFKIRKYNSINSINKYIITLSTSQYKYVEIYISYEHLYDILTILFYHYPELDYQLKEPINYKKQLGL